MNTASPAAPSAPVDAKAFRSFAEFYPFYLTEHSDRTCRRLHFAGSTLSLLCLATAIVTRNPWWLLAGLLCGYGFAWVGHFGFEKNKPASCFSPCFRTCPRPTDTVKLCAMRRLSRRSWASRKCSSPAKASNQCAT